MTFPTATESLLGNGKWEAGPSLVVLTTPGHWVIGALAKNQWSFAGWGKNNVDAAVSNNARSLGVSPLRRCTKWRVKPVHSSTSTRRSVILMRGSSA